MRDCCTLLHRKYSNQIKRNIKCTTALWEEIRISRISERRRRRDPTQPYSGSGVFQHLRAANRGFHDGDHVVRETLRVLPLISKPTFIRRVQNLRAGLEAFRGYRGHHGWIIRGGGDLRFQRSSQLDYQRRLRSGWLAAAFHRGCLLPCVIRSGGGVFFWIWCRRQLVRLELLLLSATAVRWSASLQLAKWFLSSFIFLCVVFYHVLVWCCFFPFNWC